VVHEQSQRLSACAEQPRTFRHLPSTMPATRTQVAPERSGRLVCSIIELPAGQRACKARLASPLRQAASARSVRWAAANPTRPTCSSMRLGSGSKTPYARVSCAERDEPRCSSRVNHRPLTQRLSGKPAVKPNPSFKPTRYGRQRKLGVRRLRHLRTPSLRCLPPRAA
jgi:hypothetical protein